VRGPVRTIPRAALCRAPRPGASPSACRRLRRKWCQRHDSNVRTCAYWPIHRHAQAVDGVTLKPLGHADEMKKPALWLALGVMRFGLEPAGPSPRYCSHAEWVRRMSSTRALASELDSNQHPKAHSVAPRCAASGGRPHHAPFRQTPDALGLVQVPSGDRLHQLARCLHALQGGGRCFTKFSAFLLDGQHSTFALSSKRACPSRVSPSARRRRERGRPQPVRSWRPRLHRCAVLGAIVPQLSRTAKLPGAMQATPPRRRAWRPRRRAWLRPRELGQGICALPGFRRGAQCRMALPPKQPTP
jgi:hypothetical protein